MWNRGLVALAAGLAIGTSASAAPARYPLEVVVNSSPTTAETATVRGILSRSFGKEWSDFEHNAGRHVRFTVAHADINGDGRPDLLISLDDPGFGYCGSGGCAGYAILATAQGYAPRAIELAYFFAKAVILPAVHHGMRDLRFDDARKVFQWDGKSYQ